MINALKYVEELEQTGFTSEQAKTTVTTWIELMNDNLATKDDLKELEIKVSNRIDSIDDKFVILEQKLVIKLGSMFVGGFALLAYILKN